MLHVPVALITEKLRAQSLDDDHVKVPREGALQIKGKNVWLSCDGESKDHEGNSSPNSSRRGEKEGTSPGGASSLPFPRPLNDNERPGPPGPGMGPQHLCPQGAYMQGPGSGGAHRSGPVKPTVRFRSGHNNSQSSQNEGPLRTDCSFIAARAFETPPKKRHCRSLTEPQHQATPPAVQGTGVGVGGAGVASTSPLVEGARVWRPIAVAAMMNSQGGRGTGGGTPLAQDCTARSLGGGGTVVPPHHHHHHHLYHPHHTHHHHHHPSHPHHYPQDYAGWPVGGFTTISSCVTVTAGRLQRDLRGVGGDSSGGGGGGGGGKEEGSTPPSFPLPPPSPLSVDSGRDTTSDPHLTPPQSPVSLVPPRPSSAISVWSAHSQPFMGASCWTGATGGGGALSSSSAWSSASASSSRSSLRGEILQSRSLSCEEHMSSSTTPDLQPPSFSPSWGMIGGGGGGFTGVGGASEGGPSVHSACGGGGEGKIPRCHSQPCVLHHRRYGKKRRRDDRPTLDFHKMTETAYCGRPAPSITPAQDIQKGRWRGEMDYMRVGGGLMPIASSPRDTDLPATPRATDHAALSTICDLDMALSPSPPSVSDVSSGIDIREPVKLLGEEEEEEEEEELEDQEGGSNCDCHQDSRRDDRAGLFPLIDLDLEQIENH